MSAAKANDLVLMLGFGGFALRTPQAGAWIPAEQATELALVPVGGSPAAARAGG
jgi:hypothetical protein